MNQLFPNESFLPEHQIVADVLSHEYIPVVRACFSSSVPCFPLLIYSNSHAEINPFSSYPHPAKNAHELSRTQKSSSNILSLLPQHPSFPFFPFNHIFTLTGFTTFFEFVREQWYDRALSREEWDALPAQYGHGKLYDGTEITVGCFFSFFPFRFISFCLTPQRLSSKRNRMYC